MSMKEEKCCGNCAFHSRANDEDDWICENPDSDNYGVWTEYGDSCDEHQNGSDEY